VVVTRQRVRVALGCLWLVDAALQAQPAMTTTRFATQVLAPGATGQPWLVAAPVEQFVRLISAHPLPWDAGFAVVQLLIGVGLLVPRTARAAVVASVAWGLGIWWLGEGLGGLLGGHADLLTGAPGAALLYVVLAVAAWPATTPAGQPVRTLPGWLAGVWAAVWVGGAVLRLLPGQIDSRTVAAEVAASASGGPSWLGGVDQAVAAAAAASGPALAVGWVAVLLLVGLGGLVPGRVRTAAAGCGASLALMVWLLGEGLAQPWSGLATDPNSGPLLVLCSAALLGVKVTYPRHARRASTSRPAAGMPLRAPLSPALLPPPAPLGAPASTWTLAAMGGPVNGRGWPDSRGGWGTPP